MNYSLLILDIDSRGVASVTLNRPEIHNAFNDKLIAELTSVFKQLDSDQKVRLAVLSGNGKSFCAGGDMNWMKAMKHYSEAENISDAQHLAHMFSTIRNFSKPLIGIVHGNALGGGSGLASVCDYVIAAEDTKFGFTETRLGLLPATIAPFVMEKIGTSAALAYFTSGCKFDASTAKAMGLIHRLVPAANLAAAREEIIAEFLKAGPEASCKAKALVHEVMRLSRQGTPQDVTTYTVNAIAQVRVGSEGQEGMSALLEGRPPIWSKTA